MPDADYYVLLGVEPGADATTIRSAWAVEQRLWGVRQNAPDLATRHEAERRVQLLGEIKDVLLDARRRAQYDRERAAGTRAARPVPLPNEEKLVLRETGSSASPRLSFAARHQEILTPAAVGLAGGLITGSQVLHWDVPLMLAVVLLVCMPVYAFDALGLRSVAWTFRTRARAISSWVVLSALTLYCAASVLSRM